MVSRPMQNDIQRLLEVFSDNQGQFPRNPSSVHQRIAQLSIEAGLMNLSVFSNVTSRTAKRIESDAILWSEARTIFISKLKQASPN
jgi:hypothetical protein